MHKARAMLDALMGPGRDEVEKEGTGGKEKFKDSSVCKSFLCGFCPLDTTILGGKRKLGLCERIHSELMKEQLEKHADVEKLKRDYEQQSIRDLEHVIRECEGHIAIEQNRIREDVRRKKPPLPITVNDKLAQMKRESSALIQKAEGLDDDKSKEKEALVAQANEILKEREEVLEAETKKAIDQLPSQVVCEVCGTAYEGEAGNAAHKQFRIHEAYVLVRERLAALKPKVEEWQKSQDAGSSKDKDNGKASKSRGKDKDKEKDKDRDRDKDKDKDKDRDKDKDKDKDKDRDGEKDRDKDRSSRDKRRRSRSRSRRRRSRSRRRRSESRSRSRGRRRR